MFLYLALRNLPRLPISVGIIGLIAVAYGSAAGEADVNRPHPILAAEYTAAFEALTPSGARTHY